MSSEFLEALRQTLGPDAVLTEASDRAGYERGWRYGAGQALAIARPRSTDEVSATLRLAREHGIPVQPIGANTGLVGASNPDSTGTQLVLSLERLTSTLEIDPINRTARVSAGATLSGLNSALAEHGLFFPVDLGADPQIGGMVATNTGGTRLVRYGDVRRHVLGLEVVLGDGSVWRKMNGLRKDNTGLDWKQLFIGTSGSFGIVTKALLNVQPKPRQIGAVLAACESGEAVLHLLQHVEMYAGEFLSAFEVLSGAALQATLRHGVDLRDPFPGESPAYAVLVELSTTLGAEHLDLPEFLIEMLAPLTEGDHGLLDIVVENAQHFWHLRHQVSESLAHEGKVLAFDISVPRSKLSQFTQAVAQQVTAKVPGARICDFGHWGDGGTHLNIVLPKDTSITAGDATWRELQSLVYGTCVRDFQGSYSAEHGVGPHNQPFYQEFTPQPVRTLCGVLRGHLDPGRLLGTVQLD